MTTPVKEQRTKILSYRNLLNIDEKIIQSIDNYNEWSWKGQGN